MMISFTDSRISFLARKLLDTLGLTIGDIVDTIKMTARSSLAQTDKRSNVV